MIFILGELVVVLFFNGNYLKVVKWFVILYVYYEVKFGFMDVKIFGVFSLVGVVYL